MTILKTIYPLVICFLMLTLVSCESIDSSELDPKASVFQDYYIIYNKTNKTTEVRATFKRLDDNGVRIVLSKNSSVEFNGSKEDSYTTLFDHFYYWKRKGLLDVEIVYTKDSKTSFVNTFEAMNAPFIDFKDDFTGLSLDSKSTIGWKGGSLEKNEEIQIQITQGDNSISYFTSIGATTIEVNALETVKFKKGKAKISLLKKHISNKISNSDQNAGGRFSYASEVVREISIN